MHTILLLLIGQPKILVNEHPYTEKRSIPPLQCEVLGEMGSWSQVGAPMARRLRSGGFPANFCMQVCPHRFQPLTLSLTKFKQKTHTLSLTFSVKSISLKWHARGTTNIVRAPTPFPAQEMHYCLSNLMTRTAGVRSLIANWPAHLLDT